MEIFAIKKDWTVIKEFKTFKEANNYNNSEVFQILYRNNTSAPIHIYKQF